MNTKIHSLKYVLNVKHSLFIISVLPKNYENTKYMYLHRKTKDLLRKLFNKHKDKVE